MTDISDSADEQNIALLDSSSDRRSSNDSFDEVLYKDPSRYKSLHGRIRAWLVSRLRTRRRSFRRNPILFLVSVLKYLLVLLVAILVATPVLAPSYTRLPPHYRELQERCQGPVAKAGCANRHNDKVFLSVSLYDKNGHLAGGRWGETVLELIHILGPEDTYLSIYENDSPGGEEALQAFKSKVPCKHNIVYEAHVPFDPFPKVTLQDGTESMKRLVYLSEMRNRALEPLDGYSEKLGYGDEEHLERFDKVLFLNDVAFNAIDAAHLLFSTNQGSDGRSRYLSTCSLDYQHPLLFYDLYAQRDAEGYSNGLPIFPIFSTAGSGISRADMLAQKDAVRVKSCWGGMVAMQAKYVQTMAAKYPPDAFRRIGAHVIDPAAPEDSNIQVFPVQAPVRFRYEPEVYFDACECCLFLADVSTVAEKDKASEQGVFVNPYVRVAYDESVLKWLPIVRRWERLFSIPQRIISYFVGLPRNNPYREVQEGEAFTEEIWKPDKGGAGGSWELVQRTGRSGMFCAVREMQVLQKKARTGDKNWKNVEMPPGQHLDFPS